MAEMESKDFVLEIGTEELPPSVVLKAREPFLVDTLFGSAELATGKRHVYTTPRRIIIHIENLPSFYNRGEIGPPKRIAYDKNGKPTRAIEGFLKKIEATEKDITEIPKNDNEKVVVMKKIATKNLIAERIAKLIKYFESYKTMLWERDSDIRFPRPIRWILALHGNEVIPANLDGIKTANITYSKRPLVSDAIEIKNADDFFIKLRKNGIIYNFEERKSVIKKFLQKSTWHENQQLLDEVTGLVEYPEFIKGGFDKKYLQLPQEILIASMSKNQRIFPLEKEGKLINEFVGVIDGKYGIFKKKKITTHYEQVLDAKLKDALFFYNEDLKKPLPERVKELNGMIFHKKLGSYADKIERLKKLAAFFKKPFKLTNTDYEKIIKAIELCKADLLTQMVGEFPSLQGVIGKYYAIKGGIDNEVAIAIEEHYRPRSYGDKLPETKPGTILALLDKFDSVICHFKAGHQPKGNRDLYALRRQTIGIINIISNSGIELSLSDIFDKVFEIAPLDADKKRLKGEFTEFVRGRLTAIMESKFSRQDLINAVLSSGYDNIYRFYLRLRALNNIINEFYFEQARCVVERTNNITKNVSGFIKEIDISLLQMQEEKQLYEKYKTVRDRIKAFIQQDRYAEATKIYGNTLADITNSFFDKVMVNVENEKLKNNRLKLLKEINELYTKDVADLAKITGGKENAT